MACITNKCACKGKRTCLLCEGDFKTESETFTREYIYCDECEYAWLKHDAETTHCCSSGNRSAGVEFSGIAIENDFITFREEADLIKEIYKTTFVDSQSGRRKQDYGPKVNFKKQKLNCKSYSGLPNYSKFIYERIKNLPYLANFYPVELCNLEYTVNRGSAIDPHFDDFWLWGERLVSLNLLSSTILSFTKPDLPSSVVSVLLPRRSLVTVQGEARDRWLHGIRRADITNDRVVMTFRELSQGFCNSTENRDLADDLVDLAMKFNGKAVVC